jgi:hypothetical protein
VAVNRWRSYLLELSPPSGHSKGEGVLPEYQYSFLSPMSLGSGAQFLDALLVGTDLSLTPEEKQEALAIISGLPTDAHVMDFLTACDEWLAEQLGVSVEALEGFRPLIAALPK